MQPRRVCKSGEETVQNRLEGVQLWEACRAGWGQITGRTGEMGQMRGGCKVDQGGMCKKPRPGTVQSWE